MNTPDRSEVRLLVDHRGALRTLAGVEIITVDYVAWYNQQRFMHRLGRILSAAPYYAQHAARTNRSVHRNPRVHETRNASLNVGGLLEEMERVVRVLIRPWRKSITIMLHDHRNDPSFTTRQCEPVQLGYACQSTDTHLFSNTLCLVKVVGGNEQAQGYAAVG